MLRRMLTPLLALALLALAPLLSPAAADAQGLRARAVGVTLPPDLIALEQRMLALQVTSEKFSFSETLSGAAAPQGPLGAFGRAAASATLATVTGEMGFEPLQGRFEADLFGAFKFAGREIGTTAYVEEPEIAKIDGGRPWVEEPNEPLDRSSGTDLTGLGAGGAGGAQQAFGLLATELGEASSIVEVGPRNVDGQPVTVFRAMIPIDSLSQERAHQRHTLLKVFEPLFRVEAMFTESGEPLRELVVFSARRGRLQLIAQEDLLALNQPVAPVEPPPASKTVTAAQLKVIEKRQEQRALRELREFERKHKHRHR